MSSRMKISFFIFLLVIFASYAEDDESTTTTEQTKKNTDETTPTTTATTTGTTPPKTTRRDDTTTTAQCISQYSPDHDFVSYVIDIDVSSLHTVELIGLATFVAEFSGKVHDNSDKKATLCFKFYNASVEPFAVFNLTHKIDETDASKIVEQIIKTPVVGVCSSRNAAHKAWIGVELFRASANKQESWGEQAKKYSQQRRLQKQKVALVLFSSFNNPGENSNVEGVVTAVGDERMPALPADTFQMLCHVLVPFLVSKVKDVFKKCHYDLGKLSCYYDSPQMSILEEQQHPSSSVDKEIVPFCGSPPPDKKAPCNDTECEQACSERLFNETCRPECGPGVQNLSLTGGYKYCTPRWRDCTNGPCNGNGPNGTGLPGVHATPSAQKVLGQAFIGLGSIMFLLSGIGLLVMWLLIWRKSKSGNTKRGSPKSDAGTPKGDAESPKAVGGGSPKSK